MIGSTGGLESRAMRPSDGRNVGLSWNSPLAFDIYYVAGVLCPWWTEATVMCQIPGGVPDNVEPRVAKSLILRRRESPQPVGFLSTLLEH